MESRGVVDYRYLTSIWPTNNLPGIVISVKFLRLKFLQYIADIHDQRDSRYVGDINGFVKRLFMCFLQIVQKVFAL
jgi:hypothetical protein